MLALRVPTRPYQPACPPCLLALARARLRSRTSIIIYLTRTTTTRQGGAQFGSIGHRAAANFARPRRHGPAHRSRRACLTCTSARLQQELRRHRPDEEGSVKRRSSARLDRHRGHLGTSASSHTSPLVVRAAMRLGHARSRRRHRSRCLLRAPGGFAPAGSL